MSPRRYNANEDGGYTPRPPPTPPWSTVAPLNCYAWWDPMAAADSGSPNYYVTTIPNRSGISGASSGLAVFSNSLRRASPPAWPLAAVFNSDSQGSPGAPMTTASQNGSWSIVFRADPGAAGQWAIQILNDSNGNLRSRLYGSRTQIGVHRQVNYPTPETFWTQTFATLAAGRHTYGVSFVRGSPNSVATFYVDGVSVGSATQTTLDLSLGTTLARLTYSGLTYSGGGWWNVALTAQQHATIQAYMAYVDP